MKIALMTFSYFTGVLFIGFAACVMIAMQVNPGDVVQGERAIVVCLITSLWSIVIGCFAFSKQASRALILIGLAAGVLFGLIGAAAMLVLIIIHTAAYGRE